MKNLSIIFSIAFLFVLSISSMANDNMELVTADQAEQIVNTNSVEVIHFETIDLQAEDMIKCGINVRTELPDGTIIEGRIETKGFFTCIGLKLADLFNKNL